MNRTFVMLAKQRSGTRAFGNMLSNHPNVEYRNEILHRNAQKTPFGFFTSTKSLVAADPALWMPERRAEVFEAYLASEYERHPEPVRLVYDVKYNQTHHLDSYIQERWLQPPRFLNIALKNGISIIHIKRLNLLASCLSTIRAEKSGIWHISTGDKQTDSYKVDPERVIRELHARQQELDSFDGWLSGYPSLLEVIYEDFYSETGPKPSEVERVSEFLKLKNPLEPKTKVGRQSSGQYSEEVENWDELVDRLAQSGLSKYTDLYNDSI